MKERLIFFSFFCTIKIGDGGMNKTKIIASIGPASSDKEVLREMFYKGMNVVRLNLSHATYDFCRDVAEKIRQINEELDANIALMLDTKGPDVRLGRFASGHVYLKQGDKVRIYTEDLLGDNTKFSVNYKDFVKDVKEDSMIKLNDGKIELKVIEKGFDFLYCEVLNDGLIENYKGVNVPDVHLNIPFLSKKDEEDIRFAHEIKADFLALSFVSTAEDVLQVNDLLIDMNDDHMSIIAKIENQEAVEEMNNIIRVSDGVMVARGDLGVQIPMEKIPGIQKMIINKCHEAGKVSIVATEMLASMENGIRPTRAEVSDVANAVLDGADSIMLSGETTVGKYPIETLDMMARIVAATEEDINYMELLDKAMQTEKQDIAGSIAYSVTECANRLKCKAIVAPTKSGYTARKMSRFRPCCPIIAMTPDKDTLKSLALNFGVYTIYVKEFETFDEMMKIANIKVRDVMSIEEGDKMIVTGGYPFKKIKSTNFMKIEEL